MSELDQRIESVLADSLGVKATAIHDGLAMADLPAWDSLKHMELIVAIEQTFELELSFDEIVTMVDVAQIKRVIHEKCAVA